MYTYGWQRAETLGALINGVFLVALCLSIFLEAIQRLVEPQEVSHPKLVLVVGCFGLTSNIIGLFLFHDHEHGPSRRSHGHNEASAAEEGYTQGVYKGDQIAANEQGNMVNVLPQNFVGTFPAANGAQESPGSRNQDMSGYPLSMSGDRSIKCHQHSRSCDYSNLEEIYVRPSSFRNSIIEPSRMEEDPDLNGDMENALVDGAELTENSSLLYKAKSKDLDGRASLRNECRFQHNHKKPKEDGKAGYGHSHDLNMRGVFLHVMGDALGNVGVISSALIIWLTPFWWRFYFDPLISLLITVIILFSAVPLCKAASRILLQAVPAGLSIDEIRYDIANLDGIISCHHFHVWQLSETKLVASLHVQLAFNFKEEGLARYMDLARQIRKCLHGYGIHSSTIQPEICLDITHAHSQKGTEESSCEDEHVGSARGSNNTSVKDNHDACLLECGEDCGDSKQ